MFRRLLIEDSAAWFTITAFVTALSIYVAFAWRALRMKRDQVRYFEYLPFQNDGTGRKPLEGRGSPRRSPAKAGPPSPLCERNSGLGGLLRQGFGAPGDVRHVVARRAKTGARPSIECAAEES